MLEERRIGQETELGHQKIQVDRTERLSRKIQYNYAAGNLGRKGKIRGMVQEIGQKFDGDQSIRKSKQKEESEGSGTYES